MKYRSLSILLVSISVFFFSASSSVNSQGVPVSANGIELSASTDYPIPGQTVKVTVRSYSIDIDSATITWIKNGKTIKKGVGETILQVSAPPLGKIMEITVTAVTANKLTFSRSIKISSGSVDIILESEGYSPARFPGKIPIAYQNKFRVIAIPHLADSSGAEYDPKALVYKWSKNDKVIEDQSGYGKQILFLEGDIVPRTVNISVSVSNRDNTAHTVGYQSIVFDSPSIGFYVNDPLYGTLFNSAVTDIISIGHQKETGILAVPFGFNKPANGLGNLNLSWRINDIDYPEFSLNESLILRSPGDSEGISNISLDIRNPINILQSAENRFSVRFAADKKSADSNIF